MEFDCEIVKFNVYKAMQNPENVQSINFVGIFELLIDEFIKTDFVNDLCIEVEDFKEEIRKFEKSFSGDEFIETYFVNDLCTESFRVLVLENVSGKKNRGFSHPDHQHNLVGHVSLLIFLCRFQRFKCYGSGSRSISTMQRSETTKIAWTLFGDEKSMELVAGQIKETCNRFQVLRSIHVGLLCVQRSLEDRPSMSVVVLMLSTERDLAEVSF
ncbi:hypothetical protein GQ457_02G029840 [Hibiscus cannabinus]